MEGVEISLEVLESSLSVLEEEGLEDGVCLRKLFLQGSREEPYLPDKSRGSGFRGPFRGFRFVFFCNGGGRERRAGFDR